MASKEMLDAVNAAIAPAVVETPAPDTSKEDDEKEDGDEGEALAGDEKPDGEKPAEGKDDEAKEKGGEPPAKPAGEPAKDEKPGDKKPDAAKPKDGEKPADGAAKPDDKAKPPAKPTDPVNDPIPATVSERTRERITSLITTVKEQTAEIAQGRELFSAIESTGMNAEELGTMLSYSRLVHSADLADKKKAFTFLQGELRGLALQLGETNVGLDFLAEYPDLREQVDSGAVTEAAAREIALSRERTKVSEQSRARATETEEQAQAAHTAGSAALTDLGMTLRAVDPLYAQKMAAIEPAMKAELAKLHPTKWVEHVRKAYAAYKLPAAPVPPVNNGGTPPGPKGEPLRPHKQPSGDGAKQPTSAREAMDAALGSLGT